MRDFRSTSSCIYVDVDCNSSCWDQISRVLVYHQTVTSSQVIKRLGELRQISRNAIWQAPFHLQFIVVSCIPVPGRHNRTFIGLKELHLLSRRAQHSRLQRSNINSLTPLFVSVVCGSWISVEMLGIFIVRLYNWWGWGWKFSSYFVQPDC